MKPRLMIGGAVMVFAIGIWLLFGPSRKIVVSPLSTTVGKQQSVTLAVTLGTKGWFGQFVPTGGTVTVAPGDLVEINPDRATTTLTAPKATFAVTGRVMGNGKITIHGSSSGKTHDPVTIPVIVTRGT